MRLTKNLVLVFTLLGIAQYSNQQEATDPMDPAATQASGEVIVDEAVIVAPDQAASDLPVQDQTIEPLPEVPVEPAASESSEQAQEPEAAASQEEAFFALFSKLGEAIDGNIEPYDVSTKLVPAFMNLRSSSSSIENFGVDFLEATDKYSEYHKLLSDADSRAYGAIDRNLAILWSLKNQQHCYSDFQTSIGKIYSGWKSITAGFPKVNETSSEGQEPSQNQTEDNSTSGEIPVAPSEGASQEGQESANLLTASLNYQLYCQENTDLSDSIATLAAMLDGSSECDALQLLWDGDRDISFYTGWRDSVNDKAAYLLMYWAEGIAVENFCRSQGEQVPSEQQNQTAAENQTVTEQNQTVVEDQTVTEQNQTAADMSQTDQSAAEVLPADSGRRFLQEQAAATDMLPEDASQQDVIPPPSGETDQQNETLQITAGQQFEALIDRILRYDRMSVKSIDQTSPLNLRSFLNNIQNASFSVILINANYSLDLVYPWVDWQIGVMNNDIAAEQFYSSCINCYTTWVDKYQVEAAWLPKNSTSSIPAEASSQLITVASADDAAVQLIWTAGQCLTGTWIFAKDAPHLIYSNFGDKLASVNGDAYNVFAWGAQNSCLTQPILEGV